MKKIPTSISQIKLGNPKIRLGPANKTENPISKSPIYITTKRETLLQSHPAIGEPKPKENPIIANAKPTLFSAIPILVSLTDKIGSINIMQIIDIVQTKIAIMDLLFLKICPYVIVDSEFAS